MAINRNYLLKLSEDDDEDAFDPMDFSLEDLDRAEQENTDKFVKDYKTFYDDIKTGTKFTKNDW